MTTSEIGIGMVGYAFMGRAHSHAWRTVGSFFDIPRRPRLAAVCGRDRNAAQSVADRFGWGAVETDWRALVERDDVDIVDVCTPGSSHAPIAIAALEAGKHVICEKPLANTLAEAEQMVAAAERAAARGVRTMVAFNYRRVPAVALARRIIAEGRLGEIRHVRASYLQDWALDPELPLLWRFRREIAGTGAIGDLASHIVDLAQHLTGLRIDGLSAATETFVRQRPLEDGHGVGDVTVDDAAAFTGRFAGGALGVFEVTRLAPGRRNALRIEINGSDGSLGWNLERLNELELYEGGRAVANPGFRTVLVTEAEHPWIAAWWPPGHIIGWEHTFTHEVRDFLVSLEQGVQPEPSFLEGLQVQSVLEAIGESAAAAGTWRTVGG